MYFVFKMNRRQMLTSAGATPFETLWTQLDMDKPAFVAKMREEQKIAAEKMRLIPWATMGNWEYDMMQLVWTEYHKAGQTHIPPSHLRDTVDPPSTSDDTLPIQDELPKTPWRTLMHQGATPVERLWGQLATDKPAFVAKMRIELKKHHEYKTAHPETPTGGNVEYMMMQWVWHLFHTNGETRVPPPHIRNEPPAPQPSPHAGQFTLPPLFYHPLNSGSAQPALTQTRPHEQSVQWVQGNQIIMRPTDREVLPGERLASVRILR